MMNYEIFKEVVKEKFMDYMPDSFKGMELIVRPAEKVNMTYDAINIRGEDTTISPTIYINDMYEKYQSCGDLEETLMAACDLMAMEFAKTPQVVDVDSLTQQLVPIYEPLFADGSYGYRPNRSAKDAILKVKEYAEQGYTFAVVLDLSKYFDTLNHEILINLLRKNVKDERVVQLIKRYLKSGVMENGVVIDTEEGSPQGGNLSPLLSNVYLNEFDQEFLKRGVPCIRYADDIVLLAKSRRASERLLESSTKYLEERLKLTVNREKSRTVSVFAIRNFKFLGFALGRNGKGIYVRVHPKSWKKFKSRLKELSSRKRCQSIKPSLEKIKVYARGWLNYYGIASMKNNIDDINGWLYHRIRMCIWKQWKKPRTKYKNLVKLGIPEHYAATIANSRRKYWYISNNKAVIWALNKERLINSGFYDLATAYQSVHVNY